jgi:hypothetical protein
MPKFKLSSLFSADMAKRLTESDEFYNNVYDSRLKELNKIYSSIKTLPDAAISGENAANAISAGVDKFLDGITSTKLGETGGALMYMALLIATLPVTLGQAAGIHWEKKITRFIRKAERPELLAATDYIQAYYRGKLKIEEVKDKLSLLGLPDTEIDYLLRLTQSIPSATDVISFAVREVYTPEIAARFGQYEGAEKIYDIAKDDLQAVGMSEDTFRKYWAAHWGLPSIQQGYEMLQRGVISDSDLAMLMEAADIMPFWRDKLKNISYVPLTRVDVRRMNKMGILNKADVIMAYKNIGYNQRDAELMTEFTLQYNQSPEAAEQTQKDVTKAASKDLTRSDIIRNYHLGIITRQIANDYLIQIGYDANETAFLLGREDFLLEEDKRDSTIKYLKEVYTRGMIDDIVATQELGKLSITSTAIDNYIKSWKLERSIKIATPSRADIMNFLKNKIIDVATAKTELTKLGYSDTYINWYFKLAKVVV